MFDSKDNEKRPDLSIVIVSYNTKETTRKCLEYVEKYSHGLDIEVIVVDNASTDDSCDMIANDFPHIRLITLSENRGFAGGNIPGMKISKGRYILLLNSDAFINRDTIEKAVKYMDEHSKTGILGCRLTNPDGSLQPSARMLPGPLNKILTRTGLAAHFPKSPFFGRVDFTWWDHSTPRKVGWVVGAFFLIRRETMEEIGYLDDRYFLYFEEVDYCLRAKRSGWDVTFYPDAQAIHLGGQSSKDNRGDIFRGMQINPIRIKSEFRYYRKNYNTLYVLMSACIEFFWCLVVYLKNIFNSSEKGAFKRIESISTMKLIVTTLISDRFSKGKT